MEMVHFIPPAQRRLVMLAAQADTAPVLVYGASGTGKSAIAKWIHLHGPRSAGPLITAHSDQNLSQSFVTAQGGTLVLSEMGNWPLSAHKTLLEYLRHKTIPHPHHPETMMLVNVRVIALTSQLLEGRAQGGLFNPDLLQKLNVFRIEMPELSKRKDEFRDIAAGILSEITRELHREHLRTLSPAAWGKLEDYEWPGNLRELRNVLRVAALTATGDSIEEAHLPDFGHDKLDFRATREEFEKFYIIELLKSNHWKIDQTCHASRIDRGTLLTKIRRYGIELDEHSNP